MSLITTNTNKTEKFDRNFGFIIFVLYVFTYNKLIYSKQEQ